MGGIKYMNSNSEIYKNSLAKNSCAAVVIPAFEPTDCLVDLVKDISRLPIEIIVVDDGSNSQCSSIWYELIPHATILHHPHNLGKGKALKTAFAHIKYALPDIRIIATMDADGQHLPQDMINVINAAHSHPRTLILGSRGLKKDVPLRSKLGNGITRFVFSAVSKTKVHDTQTGLRAFDRTLLDYMLEEAGNRYEYEMNVLLHCRQNSIPIIEIPIQTVYADEKNSTSHFDTVRDSLRIYKHIFIFAGSSFVSFLADYIFFILMNSVLPAGTYFLVLSNVTARFGSAALNYYLNSKVVFKQNGKATTALEYALLAVGILFANTLLLTFFADILNIPASLAKIMTELTLFIISFAVQSCVIFRKSSLKTQAGGSAQP